MKKVFLICPVRNASETQKKRMEDHIESLENGGVIVHYPARDTNQVDETGYRICQDNANAIREADEVHVFWDKNSTGSLFDLGVSFALNKKIKVINTDEIERTNGKSFTNMLMFWNDRCQR